ncbi:hypothetical protein BC829DRAFT_293861 [Chytridium lagenaria]|nr:hypothetical protein BC829DRAFT_293861 [Chytridium lagenaria]
MLQKTKRGEIAISKKVWTALQNGTNCGVDAVDGVSCVVVGKIRQVCLHGAKSSLKGLTLDSCRFPRFRYFGRSETFWMKAQCSNISISIRKRVDGFTSKSLVSFDASRQYFYKFAILRPLSRSRWRSCRRYLRL